MSPAEASALGTVAASWREWHARGELAQHVAAMEEALAAPGADAPSVDRAQVLYAAGLAAFRSGDLERSRARNEEALEVAREVDDPSSTALALVGLSRVAFREGDYPRVRELAALAREHGRRAGDRAAEAAPLHMLAAGTRLAGDYDGARALYLESLELARELGNERTVAMEQHNLGWVELHRGDRAAAQEFFAACRARQTGTGQAYDAAMALLNEAALAEPERCGQLLTAAEQTLAEAGIVLDPDDAFELDWLRAKGR